MPTWINSVLIVVIFPIALMFSNHKAFRLEDSYKPSRPNFVKTVDTICFIIAALTFSLLASLESIGICAASILTNLVLMVVFLRGYRTMVFHIFLKEFLDSGGSPEEFQSVRKATFPKEPTPTSMAESEVCRAYEASFYDLRLVQTGAIFSTAALVYLLITQQVWNSDIFKLPH